MNFLKKNQILLYVIAFMLVTAGYLNYTTKDHNVSDILQTTTKAEELAGTENIGDARLVNSQVNETNKENNTNTMTGAEPAASENGTSEENNKTNEVEVNEIQNANTTSANLETNTTQDNETTKQTTSNVSADDYFSKSKLERDTMYSQMLESYENVLNGINSLETQKQSASEEIKKINNTKNSIMICENLIATKGFNKCVIFVNEESVSAIIGTQELKQEEISQIQNILSRELNAKIENIHISLK